MSITLDLQMILKFLEVNLIQNYRQRQIWGFNAGPLNALTEDKEHDRNKKRQKIFFFLTLFHCYFHGAISPSCDIL